MINDINFAKGFRFVVFSFKKYKYTDNTAGKNTHYLAYMISGKAKIVTEAEVLEVSEGDVFYIPKNLKYQSFWHGNPSIEFVSLGFEFLPAFHKESYALQKIEATESDKADMLALTKKDMRSVRKIGVFYSLLARFIPKMQRSFSNKQSDFVLRVKKYLSTHPRETVSSVAKHFAISESGLYSLFKQYSDVSINDYKEQIIMKEAGELLITTDTGIEEISGALGFSSSSYFRKRFKAHFGTSPREYRKRGSL